MWKLSDQTVLTILLVAVSAWIGMLFLSMVVASLGETLTPFALLSTLKSITTRIAWEEGKNHPKLPYVLAMAGFMFATTIYLTLRGKTGH